MSKNRSGLILTLKAYGQGQKVTHGGESAANDLLLRGEGIVKYTQESAGRYTRSMRGSKELPGRPMASRLSSSGLKAL